MGRLYKALERIKTRESELAAGGPRIIQNNRIYTTDHSIEDPISKKLKRVKLDNETLNARHIINPDIEPTVQTAYKMLRTRVLQRMRTNGWRVLAVTSACQGDGKTISAVNLAISLAGDVNYNVCLVDMDLRHSSVANYLGLEPKYGVSDVLKQRVPVESALIRTDIDRLVVLPNVQTVTHSSELISSPAMYDLAASLASDPTRIVVYDMPPLLAADDMLAFEPNIDAIVFVVAEGTTKRTDTVKARELLENLNVIGTVLNRSDEKTVSYY